VSGWGSERAGGRTGWRLNWIKHQGASEYGDVYKGKKKKEQVAEKNGNVMGEEGQVCSTACTGYCVFGYKSEGRGVSV
jgi:hypothetical protein